MEDDLHDEDRLYLDGVSAPNTTELDKLLPQDGSVVAGPIRTLCCNRNRYNVLMMTLAFFGVFTAFNTTQNFVIKLLPKGLGSLSLGILYAVFSLSNFLAPVFVRKLGPRVAMVVGALAYCFYIGSLVFIISPVVLVCSAIIGWGASVLWTAQGVFITLCSTSSNIGFNSGLFWGLFQLSILPGNIASYFILKRGDDKPAPDHYETVVGWDDSNSPLFVVLGLCCVTGSLCFLLLRQPDPFDGTPMRDSTKHFMTLADACRTVHNTFQLLFTPRMLLFSPMMLYTGLGMTFWAGWFPRQQDKHYIGLVMPLFGLAEGIGGPLLGKVSDKLGRTSVICFGFVMQLGALFVSWLANEHYAKHDDMTYFYFAAPMLGLADCAFQTQCMAVLSSDYHNRSADAYAIYKLMQSLGATLGFFITPLFGASTASRHHFLMEIIVVAGLLVLGMLGYMAYQLSPKPKTARTSADSHRERPSHYSINDK